LSDSPDEIVIHSVDSCAHCGHDLSGRKADGVERRQVFDIPLPSMEVTEHRFETKTCPACHRATTSAAVAPKNISAPVQYGPRMKALGVYLKAYQLLPFKRGAELIRTLFGCSLREGTLANMVKEVSGSLDVSLAAILDILTAAKVAHFDETGCSVGGKRHWVHVASTETVTFYTTHPKRGTAAMEDMGVLPIFNGTAIHDHWKPYYYYDDCSHGLCNAHHLRELIFIHEIVGQEWAKLMKELLLQIKVAVDLAKSGNRTALQKRDVSRFIRRYRAIILKKSVVLKFWA
jgi:transposase